MRKPHWIRRLGSFIFGARLYESAKNGNGVWAGGRAYASPDVNHDLSCDVATLRERSRHAYQNSSSGRSVVESLVSLVISTGIDLEPDSGDAGSDARLRDAWVAWCDCASADRRMDFFELQRQGFRSIVQSGALLWVLVPLPDSRFVTAILPLEPDRLSSVPVGPVEPGNTFVSGIERNKYGEPKWYHIADASSDITSPLGGSLVAGSGGRPMSSFAKQGEGSRYPASQVIHLFEQLRPGQAIGEPWLAPVLGTLHQERQLVEAELTSAKVGAAHAVAITTNDGASPGPLDPDSSEDGEGRMAYNFAGGQVVRLEPGEGVEVVKNDRPSQAISPFRQMLRGDIAGACRVPQRFIDRDSSRANYSSMRADMLDTKRHLDPVQQWFSRGAVIEIYRRILPELAIDAGLMVPRIGTHERARFERANAMPDGWAYVDPQKDVAAGKASIDAGFSTKQEEIQSRGRDPRLVAQQAAREKEADAMANIKLIASIQKACDSSGVPGLTWSHVMSLGGAATAPGAFLAASIQAPAATVVSGDTAPDSAMA